MPAAFTLFTGDTRVIGGVVRVKVISCVDHVRPLLSESIAWTRHQYLRLG